jgi:56kDa selenium binding protein (SBP56)
LAQQPTPPAGHYLFAWTGDSAHDGKDFLAVIDADPASPAYGRLLTTVATDQTSLRVHHTEYAMPESGMLFANDHEAGRTFIFDLRDPLHPRIAASFNDMAGYMHPHSYLRLPNGHVLVSSSVRMQACTPALSAKAVVWLRLTITAS